MPDASAHDGNRDDLQDDEECQNLQGLALCRRDERRVAHGCRRGAQ